MAGIILTSVLRSLATCTPKASTSSSTVLQSSAEQELQKLQRTMERIRAVLEDAEEKDISDKAEQLHLRELKEVAYDAEDAVDEYEYEVLHAKVEARRKARAAHVDDKHGEVIFDLNSFHPEVPISDELVGRIKDIRQRFEEITDDWNRISLPEKDVKRRCIKKWKPIETTSCYDQSKTFGREDEKNKIIKWLLQEEEEEEERHGHLVSVLCIVGMGGLGKTTLAQMTYNDSRVCQHFDKFGWVHVSDDFDVVKLAGKICHSFTMDKDTPDEFNSINLMSLHEIHHKLKEILKGKKIFLVLDDVWNQNFELWNSLKTLLTDVGVGKILVTTRDERISKVMQTTSPIKLSHLSQDSSWLLFKKIAYKGWDHNLLEIGKKIVNKCGGLPLAIKVLAGILSLEEEEEAWVDIMESELWELDKEQDSIFPTLKLSYESLPAELKQCFIYLCLFPKGSNLDKSSVVQQWISHGFIQPKGKKMEEDVGNDYFNEFLHRSILQYDHSGLLIMHDLIHDLAQSVAKDEYLSITHLKSQHTIPKTIRHACIRIRDEFKIINLKPLGEAKKLRTLILITDYRIPNMDFLSNFTCLRTLVLYMLTKTEDLADFIGSMKHLRYLYIGFCESIPAPVYNLHHLRTLEFYGSGIKFSRDIGDLINLRHIKGLENRKYRQYPVPCEVLGLTNLQTMPLICLRDESVDNQFWKLRELNKLPNIKGSVKVESLETVAWADVNPPEAYLMDTRGIKKLALRWGRWCVDSETMDERLASQVLDSLQPHRGLRSISIVGYPGMVLPTWLGHELPALKELKIKGATRAKSFVVPVQRKSEEFCHKRHKSISLPAASASTQDLESRGWFPSLEKLSLFDMDELEEWQGAEDSQLSCLHKLFIHNCPKLRKLPSLPRLSKLRIINCDEMELQGTEDCDLPCLNELYINKCPKLRKFPSHSRLSSLQIWNCDELELQGAEDCDLPCLNELDINNCPKLRKLPSHSRLSRLRLSYCDELELLGAEDCDLRCLNELYIYSCPKLRNLPSVSRLSSLHVSNCDELELLGAEVCDLPCLNKLYIYNCPKLRKLPSLSRLSVLHIMDCDELEWQGAEDHDLPCLHELHVDNCPKLKKFPSLSLLSTLHISSCDELEWHETKNCDLSHLQELHIRDCPEMRKLPSLSHLSSLSIYNCPELKSLPSLPLLTHLCLGGQVKLELLINLPMLSRLSIESYSDETLIFPNDGSLNLIEKLSIRYCKRLRSVEGLRGIDSLHELEIKECPLLRILPDEHLPPILWDMQRNESSGAQDWYRIMF